MKKVAVVLIMLMLFTSGASAEVMGFLSMTGSEAQEGTNVPEKFRGSTDFMSSLFAALVAADFDDKDIRMNYYDSLSLMQLALHKGEINSIATPEFVGEYLMRNNSEYKLRGFFMGRLPIALACGFLKENKELCDKFSKAIKDMGDEGKIGILARDYITGPASLNPPAVKIDTFEDANTVTVALTGDLPPLDYIAADGTPAGFNTAVLAEIGRRLHVNIKPVVVETGARATALKSGRADVVFWFQVFTGYDAVQQDIPEGVITSTPYYGWNKFLLVGRK